GLINVSVKKFADRIRLDRPIAYRKESVSAAKPKFVFVRKDDSSILRNTIHSKGLKEAVKKSQWFAGDIYEHTAFAVIEESGAFTARKRTRPSRHRELAVLVVKHRTILCIEPNAPAFVGKSIAQPVI